MRNRLWRDLLSRYAAVQQQSQLLNSLHRMIDIPADSDLSPLQWSAVESQLGEIAGHISTKLKKAAREHLAASPSFENARSLNAVIGNTELTLTRHFQTFDMLLDVLSQRLMRPLGVLLAGCDILAWDALRKHQRLEVYLQPLVYLDRGFGASIMREGVPLPGGGTNPVPLIQVPYSKLVSKHSLTSVVHEVGHQALEALGLTGALTATVRSTLADLGAPLAIQRAFGLWMRELGPDFWGFCNCGVAQASTVKEILSLPPEEVFRVVPSDPHPPPYLRVLFSFWWCRRQWGQGYWTTQERDWRNLYPLASAQPRFRETIETCLSFIPAVSGLLFRHRFAQLSGRPIPALFRLQAIHPRRLHRIAVKGVATRALNFRGLSPCGQLAVFRLMRDLGILSSALLDKLMTRWLVGLASLKNRPNS